MDRLSELQLCSVRSVAFKYVHCQAWIILYAVSVEHVT